ncbi:MAG: PQQ-binding-like beta-propeller repeat protein [Planctomycetota bacterium]
MGLPIGASWNQYGGDSGNTHYQPGVYNARAFTPAWTHEYNDFDTRTPWDEHGVAVQGGRVYLTEHTNIRTPTTTRQYDVVALDLANGTELWRTPVTSDAPAGVGEPTVYNGSVYVNASSHSSSGEPLLYRLDALSGAIQGSTFYQRQHGTNFRVKPLGGALVAPAGFGAGTAGFDPLGGTLWWKNDYFDQTHAGDWEDLLAGAGQYAVFRDQVFNPVTGTLRHTNTHPDNFDLLIPFVQGDDLYYATWQPSGWDDPSSAFRIARYDLSTGGFERDYVTPGGWQSLAISPDMILLKRRFDVIGFDTQSGEQVLDVSLYLQNFNDNIALTDSHAFVMDFSKVYAIDLAQQRVTWSAPVSRDSHIAVSDGYLFVSDDRRVQAFRIAAPEPITITPTLDAQAAWNGDGFDVADGGNDMSVRQVPGPEQRSVMEFDLSGVPSDAVIFDATLTVDVGAYTSASVNGQDTFGAIEFYAYAGDGQLSNEDPAAGLTLLGVTDPITGTGELTVSLDAAVLNGLVDAGASHLGLVGLADAAGQQFALSTTEANTLFPDFFSAPELTIAYDWLAFGDLNGDGSTNSDDISAFVMALTDPQAYAATHAFVDHDIIGDFNGDGVMNNLDIFGFVQLLSAGNESEAQAIGLSIGQQIADVPEPASIGLIGLGALLLIPRPENPQ